MRTLNNWPTIRRLSILYCFSFPPSTTHSSLKFTTWLAYSRTFSVQQASNCQKADARYLLTLLEKTPFFGRRHVLQKKKKKMYGLDRWWVTRWVFLYHDTRPLAEGFKLLKTLQCIIIYWLPAHAVSLQRVAIAPCKGLRIPKSGKFLLVETVIQENFACRIRNHGLWNSEYSLRNPESHKKCGIRDAISSDIVWNLVSGIRNSRRGIQNPRLSWLSLHEANI